MTTRSRYRCSRPVRFTFDGGGASWGVAVLHRGLPAGADRLELRPERVVHLLPHRRCPGIAVAAELARASVVGGVRGAGKVTAGLSVLLLPDGVAGQVIEQDLA